MSCHFPKMCLHFFFSSKKAAGSNMPLLCPVCAQGPRKSKTGQMWAAIFPTNQIESNLADSLKGASVNWHLENEIQSKSNQIMMQDVITLNKIRPFVKWGTGGFLLLDKTRNLLLQLMVIEKSNSNFCNTLLRQDQLSTEKWESAGSKAKYASSMIQS